MRVLLPDRGRSAMGSAEQATEGQHARILTRPGANHAAADAVRACSFKRPADNLPRQTDTWPATRWAGAALGRAALG